MFKNDWKSKFCSLHPKPVFSWGNHQFMVFSLKTKVFLQKISVHVKGQSCPKENRDSEWSSFDFPDENHYLATKLVFLEKKPRKIDIADHKTQFFLKKNLSVQFNLTPWHKIVGFPRKTAVHKSKTKAFFLKQKQFASFLEEKHTSQQKNPAFSDENCGLESVNNDFPKLTAQIQISSRKIQITIFKLWFFA